MSLQYLSTRGQAPELDFEGVLLAGLAQDGGLYLPKTLPHFSAAELQSMRG
ncbi:MAG: threonine synthase, partial [Luminiphilus sp.]|nr:threonine synthase [Luminiphilus sp.]